MVDSGEPRLARRRNEVALLEEVSAELNSVHELERLVEVLMDTMVSLFSVQHCSVFLSHEDLDETLAPPPVAEEVSRRGRPTGPFSPAKRGPWAPELVLAASRGAPGRDQGKMGRQGRGSGRGIVGTAASKREAVRLNFRRKALPVAMPGEREVESHLALPMLAKDTLVGVVKLETVHEGVLSKADEGLAAIVANQAAVAIQNARLYEGLCRLNSELEARVCQRTAELEARHRELQEAQAQLLQSGKLAALGQLAAGLSHEMNTPLGALKGSVSVADKALSLLGTRDTVDAGDRSQQKALRALRHSHDLIQEASERVYGVFATLRRFAHLDEAERRWVCLQEGFEGALELLSHRLEGVQVERRYGDLPEVCCFAGEINQVLLIVLTNALDALDASRAVDPAAPRRLELRSAVEGEEVVLEVVDGGVGIAEENLERIFDPGFSTKGGRVAAGLSLSAAYRIMDKHGGSIAVHSAPGQGCRVRLRLPVAGPRPA